MPKTIAVTGVTGFVGRHLVARLRQAGYTVRGLVRAGNTGNAPDLHETVYGDLDDTGALGELAQGTAGVIHVAGAIAGVNRTAFFNANATGTSNLAEAAQTAGVDRFVLVSSLAAREPGLSYYSASKKRAEELAYDILSPGRLFVVRPPALYGPGDRATLILFRQLARRRAFISGSRQQAISWMHVSDLARLLVWAVRAENLPEQPFEPDDGKPGGYRWDELVGAAGRGEGREIGLTLLPRFVVAPVALGALLKARITGKPDVLSPQKVNEIYHADWVARGGQLAGWEPQIGFERGCAETLLWYRKHGWLPPAGETDKPAETPYGESRR